MHVFVIDEENEIDLEDRINEILLLYDEKDLIDIKYSVSTLYDSRDQVYCFSCLLLFKGEKKADLKR